jgi:hypothetical protein
MNKTIYKCLNCEKEIEIVTSVLNEYTLLSYKVEQQSTFEHWIPTIPQMLNRAKKCCRNPKIEYMGTTD